MLSNTYRCTDFIAELPTTSHRVTSQHSFVEEEVGLALERAALRRLAYAAVADVVPPAARRGAAADVILISAGSGVALGACTSAGAAGVAVCAAGVVAVQLQRLEHALQVNRLNITALEELHDLLRRVGPHLAQRGDVSARTSVTVNQA